MFDTMGLDSLIIDLDAIREIDDDTWNRMLEAGGEIIRKAHECEGLVRMFLRFRFCGIVCCVLYRFSFPQSDL